MAAAGCVGKIRQLGSNADKSDTPQEAMTCTNLVDAKLGTKGPLIPQQTETTFRRLVGTGLVAHDKEHLKDTARQVQFATGTTLAHTPQLLAFSKFAQPTKPVGRDDME